ncbi:p17/29c-like protein [Anaeramoeba flamelloides]|uniref:P17/29c-like protein n=1 Tax=Anaeramoeba flamelloides TaxID=1746091 RepID=A0ABQ8YGY1_9EUKA|nr:p17/29c-like protein [Anaeramoeba flamelloides]
MPPKRKKKNDTTSSSSSSEEEDSNSNSKSEESEESEESSGSGSESGSESKSESGSGSSSGSGSGSASESGSDSESSSEEEIEGNSKKKKKKDDESSESEEPKTNNVSNNSEEEELLSKLEPDLKTLEYKKDRDCYVYPLDYFQLGIDEFLSNNEKILSKAKKERELSENTNWAESRKRKLELIHAQNLLNANQLKENDQDNNGEQQDNLSKKSMVCFLCKQNLSNPHAQLKCACGPIFHQNCISIYLTKERKCPKCNQISKKSDIRAIFL